MKHLFPHRIGRLSYIARIVCFVLAFGAVPFFIGSMIRLMGSEPTSTVWLMPYTLVMILGYFLPFIAAPRIRDTGMNPWFCLVFLMGPIAPLAAMLALFAPANWWTERQKKNQTMPNKSSETLDR